MTEQLALLKEQNALFVFCFKEQQEQIALVLLFKRATRVIRSFVLAIKRGKAGWPTARRRGEEGGSTRAEEEAVQRKIP